MHATSITIGIPVSDLQAARRWYEKVLDVSEPDLEPVADIVEYQVGACWLQLGLGPVAATGWRDQSHCRDLPALSRLGRHLTVVVCVA